MTLKEAIVTRIRELCEEKGFNPHSLSIYCGIDNTTIYSVLGSKSQDPQISTIKKICDGLEITLGAFFSSPLFDTLEQEIK